MRLQGRASWQATMKPNVTKSQSSKFSRCARKASVLTWGDLPSSCMSGGKAFSSNPGREARLRQQGSAEAIVPSPSRWEGPNNKEDKYFE